MLIRLLANTIALLAVFFVVWGVHGGKVGEVGGSERVGATGTVAGIGFEPETRIGLDTGPAFPARPRLASTRKASAMMCELGNPDIGSEGGTTPRGTSSSGGVGSTGLGLRTVRDSGLAVGRGRPGSGPGGVSAPARTRAGVAATAGY